MATHDYILSNQSGASFRTDLNNALAAVVSNNSNSSSPTTTYAYQWWADTSANILKLRNSANNAWISICNLDGSIIADRVVTASIADDNITQALIANDAVGADQLASNSVVSASIVAGSIVNSDINASAAIAGSKIAPNFVAQTVETTGDVKTPTISGGSIGFRNMIINGDMRIAQRGTSSTANATYFDYPACDRIKYAQNGIESTVAQVGDSPAGKGFHFSTKITVTTPVSSIAAGNNMSIRIALERQDVIRLGYGNSGAKTATLSFYVKSSLTGNFGVSFVRNNRVQSHTISYSSANTWQFVEVTVVGDTSTALGGGMADEGMLIQIVPSSGTNATAGGHTNNSWIGFHTSYTGGGANMQHLVTDNSTFQVTGLQFEVGTRSTEFEHRPFGVELLMCQRYYQQLVVGQANAGVGILRASSSSNFQQLANMSQVVPMRAGATGSVVSSNSTISARRLNGSSSDNTATISFMGGSATHATVSFRFTTATGTFTNTEPYACWDEQHGGIVIEQKADY